MMKTITYDETQWRLVPIEATDEMILAFWLTWKAWGGDDGSDNRVCAGYQEMLAAAPTPPTAEQPDIDPCPQCIPGVYCKTSTCGRLAQAQTNSQGREDVKGPYYLQDSRSYVDNCPMWWKRGGKGYTTRLDEAERYTLDAAMRQHRSRPSDIPWPCHEIDALRRPTVDARRLGDIAGQADRMAAIDAARKE